jgi:hypothetical protein
VGFVLFGLERVLIADLRLDIGSSVTRTSWLAERREAVRDADEKSQSVRD